MGGQGEQEGRSEGLRRLCIGPVGGTGRGTGVLRKPASLRKGPWRSWHGGEEGSTSLTQEP